MLVSGVSEQATHTPPVRHVTVRHRTDRSKSSKQSPAHSEEPVHGAAVSDRRLVTELNERIFDGRLDEEGEMGERRKKKKEGKKGMSPIHRRRKSVSVLEITFTFTHMFPQAHIRAHYDAFHHSR